MNRCGSHAADVISHSLTAMTRLQMLNFSGKAGREHFYSSIVFLMHGTGNRLDDAGGSGFGKSLTALIGLHTLNLSGIDQFTLISIILPFLFLICTAENYMTEICGTAVSQSLTALTALHTLNLSSTAQCTSLPVLERNSDCSNIVRR